MCTILAVSYHAHRYKFLQFIIVSIIVIVDCIVVTANTNYLIRTLSIMISRESSVYKYLVLSTENPFFSIYFQLNMTQIITTKKFVECTKDGAVSIKVHRQTSLCCSSILVHVSPHHKLILVLMLWRKGGWKSPGLPSPTLLTHFIRINLQPFLVLLWSRVNILCNTEI